jgi:hypothetical protein
MSDPSLAIQGAFVARLKTNGVLPAVVGGRVLDRVPANTALPYVTVGETLVLPDKAECLNGSESFPVVHCYSDKPGYPEVKQIAADVIGALDEHLDLAISGHRLLVLELDDVRYRRDADGLTSIADITFRVVTEPEAPLTSGD